MNPNASHALAVTLAEKPGTSVLTPYQGKNMKMSRAIALTPATISPKLILEVSKAVLIQSKGGVGAL